MRWLAWSAHSEAQLKLRALDVGTLSVLLLFSGLIAPGVAALLQFQFGKPWGWLGLFLTPAAFALGGCWSQITLEVDNDSYRLRRWLLGVRWWRQTGSRRLLQSEVRNSLGRSTLYCWAPSMADPLAVVNDRFHRMDVEALAEQLKAVGERRF